MSEYIYSNVKKRIKEDFFPPKNSKDLIGGGGDDEGEEPPYEGFCRLTLTDGSVIEIEGEGELTSSDMVAENKNTTVKVDLGKLCTSIGTGVFSDCTSLTSVVIGDLVTTIDSGAFYNCTSLTSITIPSSVTSFGGYVFNGCSSLNSITSLATTAPSSSSTTFASTSPTGTLTVPTGSTGYDAWLSSLPSGWTLVEQ